LDDRKVFDILKKPILQEYFNLNQEDLKDILEKSRSLVELYKGDIVVDIGCNDGTMLNFYDKRDELNLVGFEPSGNVAREAEEKRI